MKLISSALFSLMLVALSSAATIDVTMSKTQLPPTQVRSCRTNVTAAEPEKCREPERRGKAPGRGAYLDPDPACLERGLAGGILAKALETSIDDLTADRLRGELAAGAKTRTGGR